MDFFWADLDIWLTARFRSLASKKAAIGFSYDTVDDTLSERKGDKKQESSDEEEEDFEDVDLGRMWGSCL